MKIDPFNITLSRVAQLSTDIYGLKWRPTLTRREGDPDSANDDRDWILWHLWATTEQDAIRPPREISECNKQTCHNVMDYLGDRCQAIVEIGVHRNGQHSMTNIFTGRKPTNCTYLGIDTDDRSFLNDHDRNIHTLRCNSIEQQRVRQQLTALGVQKIDLLAIDGWHSVNMAVNDWSYTDLLSDHGVVILHDTNLHPGPIALFDAVDETLFEKERRCTDLSDFGIAVFKHRKLPE